MHDYTHSYILIYISFEKQIQLKYKQLNKVTCGKNNLWEMDFPFELYSF